MIREKEKKGRRTWNKPSRRLLETQKDSEEAFCLWGGPMFSFS